MLTTLEEFRDVCGMMAIQNNWSFSTSIDLDEIYIEVEREHFDYISDEDWSFVQDNYGVIATIRYGAVYLQYIGSDMETYMPTPVRDQYSFKDKMNGFESFIEMYETLVYRK
ncbi:hypothetical protein [Endozoicomonas sp. ALB115]|uniref:hypothetical protein n=1 Tax=Endozoicomonas sp. ALB115 TaxID=3403074 RepID=UPI003BB77A80